MSLQTSYHRRLALILVFLATTLLLLSPSEVLAGPGGEIIESVFKTKIGRILMIVAGIVLAPLVAWYYLKLRRGVKQTRKDLAQLTQLYPWFEWSLIEMRVRATAAAIYSEWSSGKLESSSQYLTPEYLKAQYDILEMWEDEGRRNVTDLKEIGKIIPLHVIAQDRHHPATIRVRVPITAKDFLVDKATGKTIKGSKTNFEHSDQVFVMVYEGGEWLLHAIEKGSEDLNLASTPNEIFTSMTLPDFERAASELAGLQPTETNPAKEMESPRVRVGENKQDH